MSKFAKLAGAVGAVLAMTSAHAVNVGGVVWNPDSLFDFTTTDTMVESIVNPVVGSTIGGYAKITNMNGTGEAVFCPGCELTYVFSGFTVTNVNPVTGALTFDFGTIKVYVDNTPNFSATSANSASDGVLFLELTGHKHRDAATGLLGTLHSDPTPASTGVAGDGRGFLDVTGGLASTYFNTNTFSVFENLAATVIGQADFQFTSSFQLLPGGATFVSDDGNTYGLFGSNDLQGNSIPEPTTLALVGLALLGAGMARRRKA